jgi:hypothetical protein
VILAIVVLVAIAAPAVLHLRESARRTQSRNLLKQIGLALHNYHDVFDRLPPGGVFNAEGVAYHEWTTFLAPYLDASPWYSSVDFNHTWDHPEQVDLFRDPFHQQSLHWTNPSLGRQIRADGLVLNHYAGNQFVFYRNSSVTLQDLDGTSKRLLVADALGEFIPVGSPYGWRDVSLGLGTDPRGFGCAVRPIIQCLMGDGSVRAIDPKTDQRIIADMAGPPDRQPTIEQTARPAQIPLLDLSTIWDVRFQRSEGKDYEFIRISPDGRTAKRGSL